MNDCNSTETPVEPNIKLTRCEDEAAVNATMHRQIVGSLRYICHNRPEITYSVRLISRFMSDPRQSHLLAAKRIIRYLNGTIGYGIMYLTGQNSNDSKPKLVAYSDSDWCVIWLLERGQGVLIVWTPCVMEFKEADSVSSIHL
ncbi:PREDICTED: uncharacterized protein LOC109356304 [Lupinus angustifolius]|uniref:uncharacterized protein LOC109356304 n=1 Tax=Lupinus angustifolius TaxID=3871 RepID=UPI00092F0EDC|nr:PREDICTED: uncharacterized protein LOC109356304 [Lupinus angustifolius]